MLIKMFQKNGKYCKTVDEWINRLWFASYVRSCEIAFVYFIQREKKGKEVKEKKKNRRKYDFLKSDKMNKSCKSLQVSERVLNKH